MSSHVRILAQDPNFSLLFHLATPSFPPLLLPHTFPQEQVKCRYGRRRCFCCCRHLSHTSDLRFSHASTITTTTFELRVCVCAYVVLLLVLCLFDSYSYCLALASHSPPAEQQSRAAAQLLLLCSNKRNSQEYGVCRFIVHNVT